MAQNMTQADWCSRRDDLHAIAMGLSDVLSDIQRLKGMHTEDERFYKTMRAIGKAIYRQYSKTLDEMIVCNAEIDRK